MPKKNTEKKDDILPEIKNLKKDEAKVNIHVNHNVDSLKALVEKNIKWSQVLYEQNKKIKRRLTLMAVGSYLRLALILVPLLIAFIYLPPLFSQFWSQYSNLLGGAGASGIVGEGTQINEILGQISGDQVGEVLNLLQGR